MATKGQSYRSPHRRELDGIEARRVANRTSQSELAIKAGMSERSYRRMVTSGLAFKRHVNALAMAMRTLEADRRREQELFPFAVGKGRK